MMNGKDHAGAVRRQYETDEHLRVRQEIHEQYSVPKIDFPRWVLGRIEWRGNERVLDVGTGTGLYFLRLQALHPSVDYVGLDHSLGMLNVHPAPRRVAADAQALPFPAHTFDVVMANHMLYHVPDISLALSEFKRVLKPDGIVLTATNSVENMPEFTALFRRALMLLSPPGTLHVPQLRTTVLPYSLESGARHLARHFYGVVRHDLPGALVFTEIEPVMAYLSSWRSIDEPLLPEGVDWDDVMLIMREQINRVLLHFGELVINKLVGALVASDRGGFIRQYRMLKERSK